MEADSFFLSWPYVLFSVRSGSVGFSSVILWVRCGVDLWVGSMAGSRFLFLVLWGGWMDQTCGAKPFRVSHNRQVSSG